MDARSDKNQSLDLSRALKFLDYDLELLQILTATYMNKAYEYHAQLSNAIRINDHDAGRRTMHRLTPILHLIGSEDLIQEGEELHAALQSGEPLLDILNPFIFLDRLNKLNDELMTGYILQSGGRSCYLNSSCRFDG